MKRFDRPQLKLLAVAMMATINHRMAPEAERFLPVLPGLISHQEDCSFVRALIFLTMDRRQEALAALEQHDSEAAQALRELINE